MTEQELSSFTTADGYSSHFKPETTKFAKDHGNVVFCVPPNTAHEYQPLDFIFFCSALISKLNFNRLFSEVWLQAITTEYFTFRKVVV